MRVSNPPLNKIHVAKPKTTNMSPALNDPSSSSSSSPFSTSLIATPDWLNAYVTWQWAWQMHVYTIAAIFYFLSLFCLVAFFKGRRRLRKKKTFGLTLGLLFLTGAFRGTYFVLDPYGSEHLLPVVIRQFLFDTIYLFLTTCYSVIQMLILKITKVDVGPTKVSNKRFLVGVAGLYFATLTAVEITVGVRSDLRLLLLVPHGFFITWSIYLCVTFIYNGFKLMHYVTEITKARKELSSYSLAKRSCSNENFISRSGTLQRLNKPQIRITDEDNQAYSIVSDDESTVSDLDEISEFQTNSLGPNHFKKIAGRVSHFIDHKKVTRSRSVDVHFLVDESNGTETTPVDTTGQEMSELRLCDPHDLNQLITSDVTSLSGCVSCTGGVCSRERDDDRCGMVNILCPQLLQQQHRLQQRRSQYHQLHQLNRHKNLENPSKGSNRGSRHSLPYQRVFDGSNRGSRHSPPYQRVFDGSNRGSRHSPPYQRVFDGSNRGSRHSPPYQRVFDGSNRGSRHSPPYQRVFDGSNRGSRHSPPYQRVFDGSNRGSRHSPPYQRVFDGSNRGSRHSPPYQRVFDDRVAYDDSLDDETEFRGCANTLRAGWCSISALLHGAPSTDGTDGDESFLVDNGYMADTEVPSSNGEAKKHKQNRRKCSADQSEPPDVDSVETPLSNSSTWRTQQLMASSPSTLSLHRIRQSRMLHRVMRLTYFTTFLLIVACLFHLYALFGIYGLFSRISNPDPWPWLIFQTFYRLTEFGMGVCMAAATHLIISHKIRTSTKRKARSKLFESIEDIWKKKSLV